MARLARVIAPGYPHHVTHHVTQRGNRRRQTFFANAGYEAGLALMAEWCAQYRVEVWACCLMPNHAHLICVPQTDLPIARAITGGGKNLLFSLTCTCHRCPLY